MGIHSFSIITVSFNAGLVIEKTLKSVIGQCGVNIQYILIDGGSTDNTLDIINKYSGYIDVLVSEKDSGIYDAMNKGLAYVKGQHVIFMNAGDSFVSNNTLLNISSLLLRKDMVYYGNTLQLFANAKKRKIEYTNRFRITRYNVCHQSIIYPKSAFVGNKYNTKYKILADWALNIVLMKSYRFLHIDVDICEFKMDGVSSTRDQYKDLPFMKDLGTLIKENLGMLPYLFYISKNFIKRCMI